MAGSLIWVRGGGPQNVRRAGEVREMGEDEPGPSGERPGGYRILKAAGQPSEVARVEGIGSPKRKSLIYMTN